MIKELDPLDSPLNVLDVVVAASASTSSEVIKELDYVDSSSAVLDQVVSDSLVQVGSHDEEAAGGGLPARTSMTSTSCGRPPPAASASTSFVVDKDKFYVNSKTVVLSESVAAPMSSSDDPVDATSPRYVWELISCLSRAEFHLDFVMGTCVPEPNISFVDFTWAFEHPWLQYEMIQDQNTLQNVFHDWCSRGESLGDDVVVPLHQILSIMTRHVPPDELGRLWIAFVCVVKII